MDLDTPKPIVKKEIKDANFLLLKPLDCFKKGRIFSCYGGLVSGVRGISFLNTEYFKPVDIKYEI
jgi:hypothetical protein